MVTIFGSKLLWVVIVGVTYSYMAHKWKIEQNDLMWEVCWCVVITWNPVNWIESMPYLMTVYDFQPFRNDQTVRRAITSFVLYGWMCEIKWSKGEADCRFQETLFRPIQSMRSLYYNVCNTSSLSPWVKETFRGCLEMPNQPSAGTLIWL